MLPLPAEVEGKDTSASRPAEQEATPKAGNRVAGKAPVAHSASQGPAAAGQRLSEADWKMMQN